MKSILFGLLFFVVLDVNARGIPPGTTWFRAITDGSIKVVMSKKHAILLLTGSEDTPNRVWLFIDTGRHTIERLRVEDNNSSSCNSKKSSNGNSSLVFYTGYHGVLFMQIPKPCLFHNKKRTGEKSISLTIKVRRYNDKNDYNIYGESIYLKESEINSFPDVPFYPRQE